MPIQVALPGGCFICISFVFVFVFVFVFATICHEKGIGNCAAALLLFHLKRLPLLIFVLGNNRHLFSISLNMYDFILIKQRLCMKINFYDNSQVLDFYDYEIRKIIQISHFYNFTQSCQSILFEFYSIMSVNP